MEGSYVGDVPYQSARPELLVVFQTFVIVQRAFLLLVAPTGWGGAKTCQYPKGEDLSQHLDAGWLKAELSCNSWESM